MEPLVSVIIPVYNAENFLASCMDSILSQTYKNLEVVLVNDGSKDNSGKICKDYASRYPNVTVVNQENQGVSAARNAGMKQAKGEYVAFVDADDTMPPEALEALVKGAVKHSAHMTIGRIYENENIPTGIFEGEEYLIKALEDNPITYSVWRILYKADFIKDLSFPIGYVSHEDSYFVFTCALKLPKVLVIEDVVYNYTTVSGSASRSNFSMKKYESMCNLLAKKEEIIKRDYAHLLPLFYHLKTKIQMVVLTGLSFAKGAQFRKCEKETLARFKEVKGYFRADLPYSNPGLYRIYAKNMYYPYKVYMKIKSGARRLLRR